MRKKIVFFVLAISITTIAQLSHAQQPGKIFRIGFVDNSTASSVAARLEVFRQELSNLGWMEGKNIAFEYRFAEQKNERLPELAAELVRLKVDLIVGAGTEPVLAVKRATTGIPIVITNAADPVGAGLVASLARPGGNVTGLSALSVELNTKRLQILKDAVPKLARVGILQSPRGGGIAGDLQMKELRPAAVALKLKLEEIETQLDAKGLENAFQTAKQKQVGAITMASGGRVFAERKRLVELASKYRLLAITHRRNLWKPVVSYPMGQTLLTSTGARLFTLTRS